MDFHFKYYSVWEFSILQNFLYYFFSRGFSYLKGIVSFYKKDLYLFCDTLMSQNISVSWSLLCFIALT